ncbi:HAD family hydrolase [Robertkochia aurantiaca]|uniref:HAD family hydrolase n=1 Tax=Robertkochia aurantiaca TaxID=2873700 RepID=UPI0021049F75|nr:HAD family phosphatase [Robertkochia sp. 3YJGBD-33]
MNIIKNIIFDFGDIFINLDKPASLREICKLLPDFNLSPEVADMNERYEKGRVTTSEFIAFYRTHTGELSEKDLRFCWNAILKDFPDYRMEFLESIAKSEKYRLFLLSNTNEMHIEWVRKSMGEDQFMKFRSFFEVFYLSHEMGMRKPDKEIFEFVIDTNQLEAANTLFIDDTPENTEAAALTGLQTWNLIPGKEDIVQLFEKNYRF